MNEPHKKIRAFLALGISDETKKYCENIIASLSTQKTLKHIRWMPEEKLHITLQFFNTLDESITPALMRKIEFALTDIEPIKLEWTRIIPFPPKRPFTLALGITLNEELATLAAITNQITETLSLPARTHPFLPHLTLGRSSKIITYDPAKLNDTHKLKLPAPEPARHIILYQSTLTANGSEYTPLSRLTLPPLHPMEST